jgi:cell division protein FtsZ
MGLQVTEGLGAGARPEVGKAAAEEALDEICDHLAGSHMVFLTAGMCGGTGTGAAPVIARAAREMGILTVGVVTKPFHFESGRRMKVAEAGIAKMRKAVDTLIIIPNQNLFRIANERTIVTDAFAMVDQVLCSGVACSITDLMVKEGLVNLDFADVCSIISEMGTAMIGSGEARGERRALRAAEAAMANPLLEDTSIKSARGVLISITGGDALTLFEVDEAASRIRHEIDDDANLIVGATVDPALNDLVRVSVVATGIDQVANFQIVGMRAQPPVDPALDSIVAASVSVQYARPESGAPQGHPPLIDKGVEIRQPKSPVIRFPQPTERRRAIRRPPFLERLGFTVSEAHKAPRASGWR